MHSYTFETSHSTTVQMCLKHFCPAMDGVLVRRQKKARTTEKTNRGPRPRHPKPGSTVVVTIIGSQDACHVCTEQSVHGEASHFGHRWRGPRIGFFTYFFFSRLGPHVHRASQSPELQGPTCANLLQSANQVACLYVGKQSPCAGGWIEARRSSLGSCPSHFCGTSVALLFQRQQQV